MDENQKMDPQAVPAEETATPAPAMPAEEEATEEKPVEENA